MIKKLGKVGNSMALIINKPFLDLLHIEIDTPLDVSISGKVLIVKPVTGSVSRTRKPRKRKAR